MVRKLSTDLTIALNVDWRLSACKDSEQDLFFSDVDEDTEKALSYCRTCKIRPGCLMWALSVPERYGVWGGTTAQERDKLLSKRKRVRCPSCRSSTIVADTMHERVEICRSCGLTWQI